MLLYRSILSIAVTVVSLGCEMHGLCPDVSLCVSSLRSASGGQPADLATTAITDLLRAFAVSYGLLQVRVVPGSLLGPFLFRVLPGAISLITHFISFNINPVEVDVRKKGWRHPMSTIFFCGIVLEYIYETPVTPVSCWATRKVKVSP